MTTLAGRLLRILGLGAATAVALLVVALAIGSTAAKDSSNGNPSQQTSEQTPLIDDSDGPTRGALPPEAFDLDGIDLSVAPDYVEALGQDGQVVGYIPKQFFDKQHQSGKEPLPVYGDDLTTLIGHHVPGKGFVPLGTNLDDVQSSEVDVAPSP